MKRQHYSITINAPREKVWKTMLEDATYREWTQAFNEGGSYYEGSWETGSEIHFLGPDPETGKVGGMYARIAESRPYEYVSVEHLGMIAEGRIDTTSEEVKKWAGANENYHFKDTAGGTELTVEQDIAEEHVEMFMELWPQALQRLKAIAEQ